MKDRLTRCGPVELKDHQTFRLEYRTERVRNLFCRPRYCSQLFARCLEEVFVVLPSNHQSVTSAHRVNV
jgi:hypothetical protein